MQVSEVKSAFGKIVNYAGSKYRLTAYILRSRNGKLLYQLELSDLKANSVLIAPMEEVEYTSD